jgi:hypothetical protein
MTVKRKRIHRPKRCHRCEVLLDDQSFKRLSDKAESLKLDRSQVLRMMIQALC